MRYQYAIFALATPLVPVLTAAETAGEEKDTRQFAVLEDWMEPQYPLNLKFEGISDGTTRLLLSIDEEGTVEDWLPLYSTRKEFIPAVGKVLPQWRFNPAQSEGEPIRIVQEIEVWWRSEGGMFLLDSAKITQKAFLERSDDYAYRIARVSELDEPPEAIKIVEPQVPVVDNGRNKRKVIFYFYIDEEGNVRLPAIKELDVAVPQAQAIADALIQWKFKPPLVKGKPVVVEVSQTFLIN